MRLLLIDPYAPAGANLNTSLGWLSSAVHKAGHEVLVLDLNCRRISNHRMVLPDLVDRYSPDMIGITVMCTTYTSALQMVEHLGEYFQGYIVLGGAQIPFEQENALKDCERADFAVVGEGEETLVELIECLEAGEGLQDVQGILYRDNGEIKVNPLRKWITDLNKLPFPDYRLFGLEKVPPQYLYRISTSRGCPFRCVFCNPYNMQAKWRSRDFWLAIEELKFARIQFGVRQFDICEPVFNLTIERVMEFCELLLREEINMPWTCNSGLRADNITDEMIREMKGTGFYDMKLGVETLSPKVFASVNKGETIDDIIHAVEIGKRNGLHVSGSFILGLPGSTYQTVMESFKRAQQLGFNEMAWSMLIPYPGTLTYNWVIEHGTMYYDYKQMHQYASQVVGDEQLRVPFETPEFPLEDRLRAWEKIHWTLKTTGLGARDKSVFWKAWKTFYGLARYDPLNVSGNLSYIGHGAVSVIKRHRGAKERPFLQFKDLQEIVRAPGTKTL